ncbi:MAG: recombinase family protein [Oscillibacter sp.]|nr:recombinase family protein [Oscillibacter sp.]MBQ9618815.1 recombinase family protein [Oscillibacter sp.]
MDLSNMTAAVYLRKSRAEDGLSVEEVLSRHRETLERYAVEHGIRIVETFREVMSGESLVTRPEMLRLLESVEAGRYQAVLCMDLDRLSRGGTRERGLIWEAFKESGTLIVTPGKTYDLNSESDEMLVEFGGLLANMELRQIKKRMQRGKLAEVREGAFLVTAPYGYRNVRIDRHCTLEIHEPEARFVRMIFDWYASGIGCETIARHLTQMGARPRRAAEFRGVTVLKMLKNPAYIGKVQYNREQWSRKENRYLVKVRPESEWIVVDGIHPAIVDTETWEKCQRILKERYKPPYHDGTVKTSLMGLVRCRNCGGRMGRITHGGEQYLYCRKPGCCVSSRYDLVEGRVLDSLRQMLDTLVMEPDARRVSAAAETGERLKTLRGVLSAENRKKARLFDFLESGTYTETMFRERMEAAQRRIALLSRREKELLAELNALSGRNAAQQAATINTLLHEYADADVPKRNALLKEAVDVILYSKPRGASPDGFHLEIFLR